MRTEQVVEPVRVGGFHTHQCPPTGSALHVGDQRRDRLRPPTLVDRDNARPRSALRFWDVCPRSTLRCLGTPVHPSPSGRLAISKSRAAFAHGIWLQDAPPEPSSGDLEIAVDFHQRRPASGCLLELRAWRSRNRSPMSLWRADFASGREALRRRRSWRAISRSRRQGGGQGSRSRLTTSKPGTDLEIAQPRRWRRTTKPATQPEGGDGSRNRPGRA